MFDWQRFKAIYRFGNDVVEAVGDSEIFVAEDFADLPFPSVFLNTEVAGEPAAIGCLFAVYPLDGRPMAVLNVRLDNDQALRTYLPLGIPATAYLAEQPEETRKPGNCFGEL